MNKIIEYIIRAKDATGAGIGSALGKLKNFAKVVGTNLQNIRAGFEMLKGAASTFIGAMGKAFEFEKMTHQFKFLIGNMDEARDHMKMLQAMGDTPPFSLEEFAAASRSLMVLTDGALGFQKSLELVGDAAAATGVDIKSMADYVGRAYAIIRDGQPITRATMTLRNMGAITPEVASKLDEMQKAGKSNYEIWQALTSALGKFNGAMAETEQTGAGTMAAIGSLWDDTIRDFGGAVLETTKDALGGLLDWMKQLREDGTIEVWATQTGKAFEKVAEWAKDCADGISAVVKGVVWLYERSGLSDLVHGVNSIAQGAAAGVGALMGGGSLKDFNDEWNRASMEEIAKGYYGKKAAKAGWFGDEGKRIVERNEETALDEQKKLDEARQRGVEKHKKAEADAAKKKADEEQKIRDDMARKQEEAEKKKAEAVAKYKKDLQQDIAAADLEVQAKKIEAEQDKENEVAKKRLEAAKDYAEKLRKVSSEDEKKKLDAEKSLTDKRLDNEQKVYDYKVKCAKEAFAKEKKLADKAYQDSKEKQDAAQTRLDKAQEKVKEAWGWYKDPTTMQAKIDEYKEQKEAEKRWEKDFDRLKSKHRDWRDIEFGKLSAEDEATRQVALAKEEEQAAREDLKKIAANTEHLKAIAEALEAKEDA